MHNIFLLYYCMSYIFYIPFCTLCVKNSEDQTNYTHLLPHPHIFVYMCLCTGIHPFIILCFVALYRYYVFFYKLRVCGNPTLTKSIGAVFQQNFLPLCLCHNLVILTFQIFSLLLYLLWESVIFDITTTPHWRLKWRLAFFKRKYFKDFLFTYLFIHFIFCCARSSLLHMGFL